GAGAASPGFRHLKPVADAPHSLDFRVADSACGQLLPQLLHVDVHCARVTGEVIAPDQVEQLAALVDAPWMARQQGEQVELLRPQLDPGGTLADLMALEVDLQPAGPNEPRLVGL